MSAEIVNLRQVRKMKARTAKEQQSAENRQRFGRTRAERERTEAEAGLNVRRLDGSRREPDEKD